MITKNDPKILTKFLDYLTIMDYSIHNIEHCRYDLLVFFQFLKKYFKLSIEVKDINSFILLQVKEQDIYEYFIYLNYIRNNAPATKSRILMEIKLFYKWLISTLPTGGGEVINPTSNVKVHGEVFRLPKYLNLEMAKKIQNIFNDNNSRYPIRNNAIISLFLSSGMRLSELSNIKIGDINFNEMSIDIIGKGNTERKVYFNKRTKNLLIKYLKERDNTMINLKSPLFVSQKGKKMSNRTIQLICKNAFKLLGLEGKYTTHTLRHTAATLVYKYSGENLLLVKEFLGHKSISATEIYTHMSNEEVKNAVNKNPLANFEVKKAG